jgi:hypothetical protein
MIGDRYGWVPLRFAIPQDESEVATAWFAEGGVGRMLATFRRS